MNKIFLLMILTLMLSGCAPRWVKVGPTDEELSTAKQICEEKSEEKFPVRNEVAQRTTYSSSYEKCTRKDDCHGKKYKTVKRPEIESYTMDVNKESRHREFKHCMLRRGWEQETKWLM